MEPIHRDDLSKQFHVVKIPGKLGKEYIRNNHYSHSCHNGPMCWGLFDTDENLVGVCAFATPCSENVRGSVFGKEHKDRVVELHRLHTKDGLPKNTLSWFVTRSIQGLLEYRPNVRGIISFSDNTEGHVGTIYKALNFEFKGETASVVFYRDAEGRLRHPRQNGINISKEEAVSRGWTPERRMSKRRWLLVVGLTKQDKRVWRNMVLL